MSIVCLVLGIAALIMSLITLFSANLGLWVFFSGIVGFLCGLGYVSNMPEQKRRSMTAMVGMALCACALLIWAIWSIAFTVENEQAVPAEELTIVSTSVPSE